MQPDSPLQALIFDFDGTLADTIPLIVHAWNHALEPVFGRIWTTSEVIALFGPTDAQMLEIQLRTLPQFAENPAAMEPILENYFAQYEAAHDMAHAFDGINEMLEELQKRGIVLGLMTGKGRRVADITLRELGWSDCFACVVTGDDIPRPKPAPDGILQVLGALNIEPKSAAYIGDLWVDVQAGRDAGCRTIAAGWHAFDPQKLRDTKPDFWANSPQEILSITDSVS